MRDAAALAALLLAAACEGKHPATEVLVHFTAEPALLAGAVELRVRVYSMEGEPVLDATRPVDVAAPGGLHMVVPIVPRDGDAARRFRTEGVLLDEAGETLFRQEAALGFRENELLELWLAFDASCGDCAGGYTCFEGSCLPACFEAAPEGQTERSAPVECPDLPGCNCPCPSDECVAGRCEATIAVVSGSVGYDHTCAIVDGGTLYCWGVNGNGQLGVGDRDARDRPAPVTLPAPATAVSAGRIHTCAILDDGSLHCWGSNGNLALGAPVSGSADEPVRVGTLNGWTHVSAGGSHTCGLTEDHTLRCWGENGNAQLGLGTTTDQAAPTMVAGTFLDLEAGDIHTCALAEDGVTYCWGRYLDGRLGLGMLTANVREPTAVTAAPEAFRLVNAGRTHSCGIDPTDAPYCWGDGGSGKLGAERGDALIPERVLPTTGWQSIGGGQSHSCALRYDGTAFCWGSHLSGQLGIGGNFDDGTAEPSRVLGEGYADLLVGDDANCLIGGDGSLWCFGRNFAGALGIGNGPDQTRPRRVCFDGL